MEDFSKMPPPNSVSHAEFFQDMPWLQAPENRMTTFEEPQHMRGGLLGGSSGSEPPKMSKLQALAAARRKKAEEQKGVSSKSLEMPMTKLKLEDQVKSQEAVPLVSKGHRTETQQPQKRKNSAPHEKNIPEFESSSPGLSFEQNVEQLQAAPSAFANALFSEGPRATSAQSRSMFTLPYVQNIVVEATNAFAGPSPDDIVIAAQAKGSNVSAKPRS